MLLRARLIKFLPQAWPAKCWDSPSLSSRPPCVLSSTVPPKLNPQPLYAMVPYEIPRAAASTTLVNVAELMEARGQVASCSSVPLRLRVDPPIIGCPCKDPNKVPLMSETPQMGHWYGTKESQLHRHLSDWGGRRIDPIATHLPQLDSCKPGPLTTAAKTRCTTEELGARSVNKTQLNKVIKGSNCFSSIARCRPESGE